jgi:hypothetical protein
MAFKKGFVTPHRALWLIWLAYILLGIVYNISLPLFEAPDEFSHFRYIHWLATEHRLPDMNEDLATVGHEVWQPPLYYAVVTPFVAGIEMSDLYTVAPVNQDWSAGAGINTHFHTEAEAFPYRYTALAVHVARFISTLIGSIAVISAYGLARLVAPGTAVLAAAFVAFNPQFLFISAAVNNDALATTFGGLALWFLVWLLFQPTQRLWQFALLGFLWGLLTLTKLSGLAFGAIILAGLALIVWRQRAWIPVILGGLVTLSTAVLTAGWWFWRNWYAYGDPLAWNEMLKPIAPLIRTEAISWVETFAYAAFLRLSYWAMFGYGIHATRLFYWFVWGVMLLAAAGLLLWIWRNSRHTWRQPETQAVLLLMLWSAVVFASLLRWMRLLTDTNQGRLLFPALVSLAVLLAIGIKAISRRSKWLQHAIFCALAMWAAALPWLAIQPAYAQPKPLPQTAVFPNPNQIQFGEEIWLAGFALADPTTKPGEAVTVDLYWGALKEIDQNYQVRLRLLDADWHTVASLATVPYQGRYATLLWQPGEIFLDRYTLPPTAENAVPGRGRAVVSLHPWDNLEESLPVVVNGLPVGNELTVAHLKITPLNPPNYQPEWEVNTTFGQEAILLGYDAPETAVSGTPLPITLYWQALKPGTRDYTVFLHLLNQSGNLVAQVDGPPQQDRYPTSIWDSGEQIKDQHIMNLPADLPPGQYRLVAGLYDLESGQRLPTHSATNATQPDDRANLLIINIR